MNRYASTSLYVILVRTVRIVLEVCMIDQVGINDIMILKCTTSLLLLPAMFIRS